jgi:hypothetical protein
MKKSKFTETRIVFALKQAETGTAVAEVCRTSWGSAKLRSISITRRLVRLIQDDRISHRLSEKHCSIC